MAKEIYATPGKRKKMVASPKVYITNLGRDRIEEVRKELGVTQSTLLKRLAGKTHGYRITQVDISDWFLGKRPIPTIFFKPIYEALNRDERVDFLNNYSQQNSRNWAGYLVIENSRAIDFGASPLENYKFTKNIIEKKLRQVVDHEMRLLRPLYARIVEVYCGLSDSERKEIYGELEQLVQKYKSD